MCKLINVVPSNLSPGAQDVIIAAAGGNVTFQEAVCIISNPPTPTPTPTAPPGGQKAPRIVSFVGGASNTSPPTFPNEASILRGFPDLMGRTAQWVKVSDVSQDIVFSEECQLH